MSDHRLQNGAALERYKAIVEQKLGWGSSVAWRNQDFLTLSDKIFAETGVMLSHTTLKRIWGKLKYTSMPNSQTLNALAQFVGYTNWLEFCTNTARLQKEPNKGTNLVKGEDIPQSQLPAGVGRVYWKWLLGALPALVVLLYAFSFVFQSSTKPLNQQALNQIHFSSQPLAEGIPNTVVFKYDVSQTPGKDFAIQQSWDKRRRFAVDKETKKASSIYYWPGYFRAKLLVDGQVVKEHDLYIKSNGWLRTANSNAAQPRYFLPHEMANRPWLGIAADVLEKEQEESGALLKLGFHYVEDFGGLSSDNFTFETRFRNTYSKGDGICKFTRIFILCTDGVFIIPFSIPGCVGDLRLVCNDVQQAGKDFDFSAFGCDFSDWKDLRLRVRNKKVQLSLNGQLIHEVKYKNSAGRVVGMRFLFDGAGEVDRVRLSGEDGRVLFNDDFENGE